MKNDVRLLLVVIALFVFPLAYAQQQLVMFSMDRTPVHCQLFIANGDGTGSAFFCHPQGWTTLLRSLRTGGG